MIDRDTSYFAFGTKLTEYQILSLTQVQLFICLLFVRCLKSDTCYAEGTFIIDIVIPPDYPFKPPKVSREIKRAFT